MVLDEEFHTALSRAFGNPALTDALVAVNQKIRRVRMYDFLSRDRVETTVTEHIEILECVRAGRLEDGLRPCTGMSGTPWPWCWNGPSVR